MNRPRHEYDENGQLYGKYLWRHAFRTALLCWTDLVVWKDAGRALIAAGISIGAFIHCLLSFVFRVASALAFPISAPIFYLVMRLYQKESLRAKQEAEAKIDAHYGKRRQKISVEPVSSGITGRVEKEGQ